MPEEIEVPTEHLHETLEHESHAVHHGGGQGPPQTWISSAALSAALLAVLAAVAALLAGHYANEAMLEQIGASDHFAFFQAKSLKATVLQSKMDLLQALGKAIEPKDIAQVESYKREQAEIKEEA